MVSQVPAAPGLSKTQALYAAVIVSVGKSMHQSAQQIQEALMAGLTESGLKNYANANNPQSLAIKHDAVGSDHGSVGIFQQQVGGAPHSTANWGTTAELMNPIIATQKFYQALDTKGQHGDMASTVQNVQGSAYGSGSNYRAQQARAQQIYKADAGVSLNPADVILGAIVPAPNVMDNIGNDITGAVTAPIDAVKNGLKGIDAIASIAEQAATALVSESFWIRVGLGFIGFMFLIIGIDMLSKGGFVSAPAQQPTAQPATPAEPQPEGDGEAAGSNGAKRHAGAGRGPARKGSGNPNTGSVKAVADDAAKVSVE